MGLGGWEVGRPKRLPLQDSQRSVPALSGILLDAILGNFSRVQRLGLPLKMVMYSAVSLWEGRQCHVGTGMRGMADGNVGKEELVGWSQWNFTVTHCYPLPWVTPISKPYSQTISLEVHSLEGGR